MVPTVLLIVGNVLAILAGMWFLADRFRRWIEHKVAEPVARIEIKISGHDLEVKRHEREIIRAHTRLDRIQLGNNNA